MAVTFVVGNANRLSGLDLRAGSTIASRIANEFNEALGLQLNALIALGCILFLVTFGVLIVARIFARQGPLSMRQPPAAGRRPRLRGVWGRVRAASGWPTGP
jgi:hypothetical protein